MSKRSKPRPKRLAESPSPTLADLLTALQKVKNLSETRRRDLRSAVKGVGKLLGNGPSAIPLVMEQIQAGLATVNPVAVGMTPKRFANIRSDFVAAVKATGMIKAKGLAKAKLSPEWKDLFSRLAERRAHLGLSRLARYASAHGIQPKGVNDAVIEGFMTTVREETLHKKPKALHRQTTLIWNKVAADAGLGLKPVTVPDFRGPAKRIDETLLPASFIEDRERYLAWCGVSDPFAADARPRPLASRTLKLARDQIHAAVTALAKSGTRPDQIRSLGDMVAVENFKNILRQRLADAGGQQKSFDHYLARALVRIAKEWVKVDDVTLAELKRLASKLPAPNGYDLTTKNKRFLRQFDDPETLRRLRALPERLWKEVKKETGQRPSFRTLAKAQAALAIGLPTFMPVRPENLWGT
jgi:hypothetical protein